MLSILFLSKNFKSFITEQKLIQKLLYFNILNYINELMLLGFEYSFNTPHIITLEHTKSSFYFSILMRFNHFIKLNFNIKDYEIITNKKKHKSNVYSTFLELLKSFKSLNYFSNPLYIMVNSNAKANWNQICQLMAIKGYLTNFKGDVFKIPVLNSFSKGLNLFEYFISCYGARKGILDTALKTADSGYLTRRLVECSQELILKEYSCNSENSMEIYSYINSKGNIILPFLFLYGKTLQKNLKDQINQRILSFKHNYISEVLLNYIIKNKRKFKCKFNICSVKLCNTGRSICSKCFGYTNFKKNYLGKNLGILSSQVIGEPSTQLTLRTFHTGGTSYLQTKNKINKIKNFSLFNYYSLSNYKKYKFCLKKRFIKKSHYNHISALLYIKKNHFIYNTVINYFIIRKYQLNQLIFMNNNIIYSKNKIMLGNLLFLFLIINNIIQRKKRNIVNYINNWKGNILNINLLKLIVKNKDKEWVSINLNKSIFLKNSHIKYYVLTKEKLTLFISKNQRYSKIYVNSNVYFLYSYKEFVNFYFNLYRNIILNNNTSINYYLSLNKLINKNKYSSNILRKVQVFQTNIYPLKSKKTIII